MKMDIQRSKQDVWFVLHVANGLDVRSVLHGQMSLAAVN